MCWKMYVRAVYWHEYHRSMKQYLAISTARATTNAVTNTTTLLYLLCYVLSKYEFYFAANISTYAHSDSIFMPLLQLEQYYYY